MELLADYQINNIEHDLQNFEKNVNSLRHTIDLVIKSFESNEVVQSLYVSGRFGADEQEKIRKIRDGVNKYYDIINGEGGLVPKTYNYLQKQRDLNARGGR